MWKKEEITMQTFENKTRLEALQLGAVTNKECDQLIKEGKLPKDRWHWASTMAVYELPGVQFKKQARMKLYDKDETYIYDVPKKYQGKKDIVILANVGKNEVEPKGNEIILKPKKVVVKPMPKKDGWYMPDEYGFPSGKESSSDNQDARKLWRRTDMPFVGLLSRYCDRWDGYGRQVVNASYWDDVRFGVVINNTCTSGKTDLKPLAQEAEKAIDKMRGVVKEELLTPIKALVEAAKC